MKKLTAAMAALALFFSASAFSNEPGNELDALLNPRNSMAVSTAKVDVRIASAFSTEFAGATNVAWRQNQGLYFGYFQQDGKDLTAAYTSDGELYAMARPVKLAELPEAIAKKLSAKYADCSVEENAFEVVIDGQANYYLTLDNKKSSRLVKFSADGWEETIKKTKKKLVATVS